MANDEESKPSNNRGRPNIGPISLDECNKISNNSIEKENRNTKQKSLENMDSGLEKPHELYIQVDNEFSTSKPLSETPSLSSPVLDRVDSIKENIANSENIQPLNRSASEPAVTPPLLIPVEDLYVSTHRRLKAMHGKERFRSGDRT